MQLSQRVQTLKPSATLAMSEKARALKDKGIEVAAFAAGEPDFDTPEHIKAACRDALAAGQTKYPSPVAGVNPLRDAVCAYLQQWCGVTYKPSQICVSVGAKDTLYLAFEALLDAGDEVLIPAPYWVSYPEQVGLTGAKAVIVQPADGLKVSGADIKKVITPRTKALILNSPNNPSGAVFSRAELEDIARAIADSPILVISDEIYHRLVFSGETATCFASLPGMAERTLTVNGCSKTFAMTGWRIGYGAGPEWLIAGMSRLQGQATSGAPTFVQLAAAAALRGDQTCVDTMRKKYAERGRRMTEALNHMPGITCPEPEGAYYCFPDVSVALKRLNIPDTDVLAERILEQAHVATVSGGPFGAPRRIRLSFATSDAQIDAGLARLAKFFGG